MIQLIVLNYLRPTLKYCNQTVQHIFCTCKVESIYFNCYYLIPFNLPKYQSYYY